MCSIKVFGLNSLSPRKTFILKPLALYMTLTMFNYLIMLSALFEMKFYDVRKVILGDFV